MTKSKVATGFLLLASLAPLRAEETRFVRAYLQDDAVCFDSPIPIDWKPLAARHFDLFPLDRPDLALLREHYYEPAGSSHFKFSAPVPPEMLALRLFLLSESGAHALRATRLTGEISYGFNPRSGRVHESQFGGKICGLTEAPVTDAAFVFVSPTDAQWRHELLPTSMTKRGAQVSMPGFAASLPKPEIGDPQLKSALLFTERLSGESVLLVRRVPDFCTFMYELFTPTPELRPLQKNGYGCDP